MSNSELSRVIESQIGEILDDAKLSDDVATGEEHSPYTLRDLYDRPGVDRYKVFRDLGYEPYTPEYVARLMPSEAASVITSNETLPEGEVVTLTPVEEQ